jgi:hypothetical protein
VHPRRAVATVGRDRVGGQLSGGLKVEWTNPVKFDMTYNDNLVRQGETIDMSDTSTTQTGTVDVSAFVSGFVGIYQRDPDTPDTPWVLNSYVISPTTLSLDIGTFNCDIPLPGESPRNCDIGSQELTVFAVPVFPGIDLALKLKAELSFDSTGTPITSLRNASSAGDPPGLIPDAPLSFTPKSPATVADPVFVPCSVPVGNDLFYRLTNNSYSASTGFNVTLSVLFSVDLPTPPFPDIDFTLFSHTFPVIDFPDLAMSAPDIVENLGPVQVDNRPPVVGAVTAPSGTEGTAIAFHVDATDNCGPPTVRWDFSDGGVAFGDSPQHTFNDNGVYSGLVTATDPAGNTTTKTFSVSVANVAPSVNGGPDTSSLWGVPVSFHANGSDPGAIDNALLLYSWDFADPNSPVGGSGQDAAHTYSQPGTYNALVTVADKDLGSGTDQVQVTVVSRATTTAYTGPLSSLPSKDITLKASLVDQLNQPVVGRTVLFTLGAQSISAITDGSGVATATIKLNQKKGDYTVSAAFAGDTMYTASSNARPFKIG